jgi:hypothetical protein
MVQEHDRYEWSDIMRKIMWHIIAIMFIIALVMLTEILYIRYEQNKRIQSIPIQQWEFSEHTL